VSQSLTTKGTFCFTHLQIGSTKDQDGANGDASMPWKCEYVHEIPLRAARTWEEFQLHLAALDWTLDEPIVLDSVEDAKSRSQWNVEPFAHQVQNLITFCRRAPVTLLADDVGLGKTISAGLILSELRARKRVERALVICPKILGEQWVEELDKKFGIEARVATGKELGKEVQRSTKVVITTYTSATKELPKIDKDAFGMLILDEAHKLKHLHGAQKTPKMALSIYAALKNKLFKYVLMLTATPIQNSLWDLYSLLDCLTTAKGHINPLGTPDAFRNNFLAAPTKPRQLNLRRAEQFRNILREYIVRIRRHETQRTRTW
jgi:SNF2 family DNA or RNA helicase